MLDAEKKYKRALIMRDIMKDAEAYRLQRKIDRAVLAVFFGVMLGGVILAGMIGVVL